jgi:hypothetical protein
MAGPQFAYIRYWLLTALTAICTVSAINLLVDPFGVYGLVNLDGFNRVKVRAQQRGLLSKSYNLARVKPRALVLGNSRAEIGFDPNHSGWPADARPAYNFALPGAGLAANLHQLDYALRTTQIKRVVLGLDFLDFTFDASKLRSEIGKVFVQNTDATPPFEWARRTRDYTETLLSLDALGDSIRTILGQRNRVATSITELGFNPLLDYIPIARAFGYRALFDQRNKENARATCETARTSTCPAAETLPISTHYGHF